MSVVTVPMYAAACDRCGKRAEYGGEYVAWAEPKGAVDQATDSYEMIFLDSGRLVCNEPEPCWEWSADEAEQVEKDHPAPSTPARPVSSAGRHNEGPQR